MKVSIAHRRRDGTVQSIKDHLEGTAELAQRFADAFDAAEQGALVGMAHDIGKYSDAFQRRILEDGPKTDHATAGAFECASRNQNPAAFCVAGHHSGLPDKGSLDDYSEGTLGARLHRALAKDIPDYSAWAQEVTLPYAAYPEYLNHDALTDAFFVRMLYSCLVDADYLDTECFMDAKEEVRDSHMSMEELDARLEQYVSNWFPPRGELNEKRCRILDSCIKGGTLNQGFFTLTVPTGGGKTVSSLAFAIRHALVHGLDRIIYVVPYTSIIEQTSDTFRIILGSENVLEHHSGVEFESADRISEQDLKLSLAAENWNMPVIITTAVQFFESLFSSRSSKCRKNHSIAKSVVVFDEAQMIPIPYLRPCVYAIAQLVQHYHVSAVLCTATQPALEGVFKEFCKKFTPRELCPPDVTDDDVFRRTSIVRAGKVSWSEIAARMNQEKQVLCIVNSRKHAQNVFHNLDGKGCYHLSTLMVPADRKQKLVEIRKRLKDGDDCRVVSTSLIEAGVDVDFPMVLREEAGLDSVIQAAGRCNREGKRNRETSIVTVFEPETKPPMLFRMNIDASRAALRQCGDYSNESAIKKYFQELLFLKGPEALDKHEIIKKTASGTFPFRSIAEQFHLIERDTATIYIPIGDGAALLKRLLGGEINRSLMRKLGQYAVNVYPQQIQALSEAGDILPLGDNTWYLSNISLYNPETGISFTADCGKAFFI